MGQYQHLLKDNVEVFSRHPARNQADRYAEYARQLIVLSLESDIAWGEELRELAKAYLQMAITEASSEARVRENWHERERVKSGSETASA